MPAEISPEESLPPAIIVPLERARELQSTSRLEWLEPDGRGGYASSTVSGCNTRRYHGLLVIARRPPTDRVVLLSRIEEVLVTPEGAHYHLATNHYPGLIYPQGYRYLEEFRLDPWPVWRYRLNTLVLTRELFMAKEPGVLVLRYRLEGGAAALELRPLIAGRDFHALVTENDEVSPTATMEEGVVSYKPYPSIPTLFITHEGGEWHHDGHWYRETCYRQEAERGLADREDLYSPGFLRAPLEDDEAWTMILATERSAIEEVPRWRSDELRRRSKIAIRGRDLTGGDPFLGELGARLALAADAFVVTRGEGESIIAGYPWFADWGRDTMISLPGLCLVTGEKEIAASIIRTFTSEIRDGLIPNRFPDDGGPIPDDHYNSVDASLWLIEAVAALADTVQGEDDPVDTTHVAEYVAEFWPALLEVVEAYQRGTRFGIRMDEGDALIEHGEPGMQLTWMDARVGDWVVTPRDGKGVEINALWYNALERIAGLAPILGEDPEPYQELARRVRDSFGVFHYRQGGYLYDRITPEGEPDPSLRPNQLLAVSLPHSPVGKGVASSLLRVVERELLVPLGVRTLGVDDPRYRGRFEGGRRERDAAYHSGTAWPWLLGPFISAYLRIHGTSEESRREIQRILEPLRAHLLEYGLGQVTEVVAGDPPHRPGGCFAQAWSVAEILRLLPTIASIGRIETEANGTKS